MDPLISTTPFQQTCGGVIVSTNPYIMLSAALCTPLFSPYSEYVVQAHRFDLEKASCESENCIPLKIKKIVQHPKYDGLSYEYNFALWLQRRGVDANLWRTNDGSPTFTATQ